MEAFHLCLIGTCNILGLLLVSHEYTKIYFLSYLKKKEKKIEEFSTLSLWFYC